MNVLKVRTLYSTLFCFLCSRFLNYLDPDQTTPLPLKEQSDLVLQCLHIPFCQKTLVYYFRIFTEIEKKKKKKKKKKKLGPSKAGLNSGVVLILSGLNKWGLNSRILLYISNVFELP